MSSDRYTALAKVADGGMAEIFLAVQRGARGFERKVILKRVRAEVAQDSELLKALHDEARIAMGFAHSNIAQVLDVGEAQGRTFLVLELVDGWSLAQLMRRAHATRQTIPWAMSLFLCAQLCRALAHAHGFRRDGKPLNVVHRDLSPQNVLISSEGEVKLTDFGIARAEHREVQTRVGLVKGKPGYMSPEQARGEPLDGRSDLFSLGVMLYELATGVRPFQGASDYEVLLKVQAGIFEPPLKQEPSLPPDVAAIISQAMAKSPKDRYPTADAMLADLERVQRASFGSSGQTELKAWLQSLSDIDGQKRITERALQPPPAPGSSEWVSDVELLSSQNAPEAVAERGPTEAALQVEPPPPPSADEPRRWPLALLAVVMAAGAVGWFTINESPTPPLAMELKLDASVPAETAPIALAPAEPVDAGVEVVTPVALEEPPDAGDEPINPDAGLGSAADVASVEAEPELPAAPEADAGTPVASLPPTQNVAPAAAAAAPDAGLFASVRIVSIPTGATVRVDRTTFGTAPLNIRFRRGLVFDVTLSLKDYQEVTRRFTVVGTPGQVVTVRLAKKTR